jgi:hypothetical protein
MNVPWWDQDKERRGVIHRAFEEFSRRAPEFLDYTEDCAYAFDGDRQGIWIGVKSVHASDRFDVIHRSVFRGFAPECRHTDDERMEWRHFGYSRPSARPEKVGEVIRIVKAA